MVDALRGPQQVYALAPLSHDAAGVPITSIERMAELMVEVVRSISPSGPYRLAGYSFGALIALEVGQQLQRAGDVVDALFLIEAVYDERYWPRQIWLRALCRRTHWQITRIAKCRPEQPQRSSACAEHGSRNALYVALARGMTDSMRSIPASQPRPTSLDRQWVPIDPSGTSAA